MAGKWFRGGGGKAKAATARGAKATRAFAGSRRESFGVECSDWIEAHGSQRRDIAGGERDSGKYKGDASEGGQIGRRHAVEQSGHEVRDDERTGHTQPGASGGQSESPVQDHLEDIASLRTQRETNGNLTSLFVHHVGDGSIDSERGEEQRRRRKKRHHFHRESPDRKRGGEDVIQGLRMEDGKYRVDGLDLLADLRGNGAGIELSTKEDDQVFGAALVRAKVNLRNGRVGQRF